MGQPKAAPPPEKEEAATPQVASGGNAVAHGRRLKFSAPEIVSTSPDGTATLQIEFTVDMTGGFAFGPDGDGGDGGSGRACFTIFRAPISIGDKTGQLIHDGQIEAPYVSDACFDRPQTLTATGVPVGSYRLEGTLYTGSGELTETVPMLASAIREYRPFISRVVDERLAKFNPTYDWQR